VIRLALPAAAHVAGDGLSARHPSALLADLRPAPWSLQQGARVMMERQVRRALAPLVAFPCLVSSRTTQAMPRKGPSAHAGAARAGNRTCDGRVPPCRQQPGYTAGRHAQRCVGLRSPPVTSTRSHRADRVCASDPPRPWRGSPSVLRLPLLLPSTFLMLESAGA
jgi:hypothetical protein